VAAHCRRRWSQVDVVERCVVVVGTSCVLRLTATTQLGGRARRHDRRAVDVGVQRASTSAAAARHVLVSSRALEAIKRRRLVSQMSVLQSTQ